jgi:hypothetical protein
MPDWQNLVRQRLSGLALDDAEKAEVHAELAGHLEETYEVLRRGGVSEHEATQQTLSQVADWTDLQNRITVAKKAEDQMQNRVRQLWIPGFLTLMLSSTLLMMLQKSGLQPRIISWNELGLMLFYVPWLAALPLLGALGAYLSLRAGGSTSATLFSGVFPVLTLVASSFVILPFSLVIDRHVASHFRIEGFLNALIGWVVVPGVALLIGALPVQLFVNRQMDSQR